MLKKKLSVSIQGPQLKFIGITNDIFIKNEKFVCFFFLFSYIIKYKKVDYLG